MNGLQPLPGFEWSAVNWGGPDEPVSDQCSYCNAEIPEGSVPLMMWNEEGWCARFCDDCQKKWWGLEGDDSGAWLVDGEEAEDPLPAHDLPDLGPCCMCETTEEVCCLVMLDVQCAVPGHGWGCLVCGLPGNGAYAVLCHPCRERMVADRSLLKIACRGYPATDGRIALSELTQPFEHDYSKHREVDLERRRGW